MLISSLSPCTTKLGARCRVTGQTSASAPARAWPKWSSNQEAPRSLAVEHIRNTPNCVNTYKTDSIRYGPMVKTVFHRCASTSTRVSSRKVFSRIHALNGGEEAIHCDCFAHRASASCRNPTSCLFPSFINNRTLLCELWPGCIVNNKCLEQ